MTSQTTGQNTSKTKPPEVFTVPADADQVSCDGGGGPLGHPLVYYSFDGRAAADCLYCDRHFVKASQA